MTIPNIISSFRIVLVPLFVLTFFSPIENGIALSGIIFLLAGVSDFVDGQLARRLNQISLLGKILDPLADKLMVCAALISTTVSGLVPLWITAIFFVKEAAQGVCSFLFYKKLKNMQMSNMLGKVGTFLFYTVLAIILIFGMPEGLKLTLLSISLLLGIAAFITYIKRGVELNAQATEKGDPKE